MIRYSASISTFCRIVDAEGAKNDRKGSGSNLTARSGQAEK
jgi:hypothetical protein